MWLTLRILRPDSEAEEKGGLTVWMTLRILRPDSVAEERARRPDSMANFKACELHG